MKKSENEERFDLLQGTLDLLILKTLNQNGSMHGWGISLSIGEASREALNVKEGSLYPCLHRLERKNWIRSEWGLSENNRKAKYYELTTEGESQLERETISWTRFVEAVSLVLQTA